MRKVVISILIILSLLPALPIEASTTSIKHPAAVVHSPVLSAKKAKSARKRDEKDIIRELVYAYYNSKDEISPKVEKLLDELSDISKDTAKQWQEIIEYWHYANTEMTVEPDTFPEDLEDSSQLCIVVMGYQLKWNGSMEAELIGRLETALAWAEKYPSAYILCTGGGTSKLSSNITEAGVMAQWLEEHGVPSERLILESKSLNTTENAKYSEEILHNDYPDITSVIIVSSDYHIPWCAVLFQTQFILSQRSITIVANGAYTPEKAHVFNYRSSQMRGILELAGL